MFVNKITMNTKEVLNEKQKITTSLLTAGMVLAIGITPFVHSNTMEAATLISQSDHEK